MNQFNAEYTARLRAISSDVQVEGLYRWFWANQEAIARTAAEINGALALDGDFALKSDLPCLTMGSRKGLLFVLVNPGWGEEDNRKEDEFCRTSPENYLDLMLHFFTRHPQIVGRRIGFTAQMISFVGVLQNGLNRFGNPATAEARWRRAESSQMIGHWELFPFHSKSDGLTKYMNRVEWLRTCVKESLSAALRLEPEALLVMSKDGWNIVRNVLYPSERWIDTKVGAPATSLSYCKIASAETEIVAVARQWISSPRVCTNDALFEAVNECRRVHSAPGL
jgi:hypothetical protein